MEVSQFCVLTLLLTAAGTYGLPTVPPAQPGHEVHVPHQPREEPPPHHGVVGDKPAQPFVPHDGTVGNVLCINDYNCTSSPMGENSLCHGTQCVCTADTIPSPTSQRCLAESSLGSGCEEDWQCTRPLGDNVYCKGKLCTCTDNSVRINNKCFKQKLLSEQCNDAAECIKGVNSECVDHRCVCKIGMVPKSTNDKCLPVAKKFGDSCEEDIQCTETFGQSGTCTNGKCSCQENYHFKNHACMKNLVLGDPCGTGIDGDCFLIHSMGVDHVQCTDGKCQCKGDLTPSSDNAKCLNQGQTDLGDGGGAETVQPLVITIFFILFAILLSS